MDRARGAVARQSEGTVRLTRLTRLTRLPRLPRMRAAASALTLTVSALTLLSCASPGMPPGGPPDAVAPEVVAVRPDSGAVNVRASSAIIRFSEVVSEGPRTPGAGTGGLGAVVIVSPGDGLERVHWRRNAIEIEPRDGFRAGTAYRITLLPGIVDLRGNVMTESRSVVFSTGADIPDGTISGAVFDWVAGAPAPNARVEAFLPADSTFRWMARADSTGRYALRNLRAGTYMLRGFIDQNNNRGLDRREAFDALAVTLDSTISIDLYAFVHDTVGPRIETVARVDSSALRVRFNTAVAVDWAPTETAFVLIRTDADSAVVPLGEAVPAARFDSITTAARAAADSIALDSTVRANPADSVAARRLAELVERSRVAAIADTTTDSLVVERPTSGRPTPVREWVIGLPQPLVPGAYLLRAVEIPGLSAARETSERAFVIDPPPPPAPDTTGAPMSGHAASASPRHR